MVVVCPTPIGLGNAVTYANVGMLHAGVCAEMVGISASVALIEITNKKVIAIAVVFWLNFCIFLVLHYFGAGLKVGNLI